MASDRPSSEPNITCPKCRHRHPASRSCAEAKRLADEAQAERWRLKQLEREQESSKERLIRSLLHAYEEARDSSAPGPCEILKEAADEIERLTRERDELAAHDSQCIKDRAEFLMEIERLKRVYESAVRGRQDFRKAYRDAKELLNRMVKAWEGSGENMDRLCEIARNGPIPNSELVDAPLSWMDDGAADETTAAPEPAIPLEFNDSLWGVWWAKQKHLRGSTQALTAAYFELSKSAFDAGWRAAKEDSKNVG